VEERAVENSPYRTVLFAHDGSDRARVAFPHLVALGGSGVNLILCHVIDVGESVHGRPEAEATEDAPGVEYSTVLETMRLDLETAGMPNVETRVLEGPVAETLARVALELEADLVVTVTRGRGGWRRALLGSVAEYLVRHTPAAAVLVIPAE
jgi:nucleotide-binding universal stress UspA family protein